MRWGFVGAGALGGLIGSRLLAAGFPVEFLVRRARRQQLETHGLLVKSPLGDYAGRPPAVEDPHDLGPLDILVVAVKAPHLPSVMETLARIPDVPIMPVLNGVEHVTRLSEQFPGRVIPAVVFAEATLDANDPRGTIHHYALNRVIAGPLDSGLAPLTETLVGELRQAGMAAEMAPNIHQALWQKYLAIDVLSGLTATTDLPVGALMRHPETRRLVTLLVQEFVAVAHGAGTEVNPAFLDALLQNANPTMKASMARDKERGLPLEADHLQGAIVRMGHAFNVPTPIHETLLGLLAPFAAGRPAAP